VTKNADEVTPAIEAFIGGGLRYGRIYGYDPKNRFDLSADHDTKIYALHKNLVISLQREGYLNKDWRPVSMTVLEYITPLIEEREAGSRTKTLEIIEAVAEHVTATEVEAKKDGAHDVPPPAIDLKTGIPKTALTKWIDATATQSRNALAALAALMEYKGTVYHQVTTGVLPSEIPGLFEQGAEEIEQGTLSAKSEIIRATLLTESVRIARETVEDYAFNLSITVGNVRPIEGWLTLLAQYLLAARVEATTASFAGNKNRIPFLSKTNLTKSIQALPKKLRPKNNDKWRSILMTLVNNVKEIAVLEWVKGLEERESPNKVLRQPFPPPKPPLNDDDLIELLLDALIQGEEVKVVGPGKQLDLDKGQEILTPELTIPGEQAIPLEDRYAYAKGENFSDPAEIRQTLTQEWDKALIRRFQSTTKGEGQIESDRKENQGSFALLTEEQTVAALEKRLDRWVDLSVSTNEPTWTRDLVYTKGEINKNLATVRNFLTTRTEREAAERAWKNLGEIEERLYKEVLWRQSGRLKQLARDEAHWPASVPQEEQNSPAAPAPEAPSRWPTTGRSASTRQRPFERPPRGSGGGV
jgi:hypothetical protein